MSASGSSISPNEPSAGEARVERPGPDEAVVMALFLTSTTWLVLAWAFALIASIKFHSPQFLADLPWLTYGRVQAASSTLSLYGFCVPAGMGAALWIGMRSGAARLALPAFAWLGMALMNLGVTIGLGGLLAGDLSGYEGFEMPSYAAVFVFMGSVLLGVSAVLTLQARQNRHMSVPQWFLLAAFFWFPWIYSTAMLLLLVLPVRGVAQSVIAWWYARNLQLVWFGLVGLASAFYLLPRALGRELNSRNLALFAFWTLVLFGSWTGIPQSAPVPAWIPTLSTAATVLTLVFYIAVFLVLWATTRGACRAAWSGEARFASFGVAAFLASGALAVACAALGRDDVLTFTWAGVARDNLLVYGFFGFVLFGCMHAFADEISFSPGEASWLRGIQFWLAGTGVVLLASALIGAGLLEAVRLHDPQVAFVDISKSTLHFLRLSTVGDLLILVANVLMLLRLASVGVAITRSRARLAVATATAEVTR